MAVFMAHKWGLPTTYKSWGPILQALRGIRLDSIFVGILIRVGNISWTPGRDDW